MNRACPAWPDGMSPTRWTAEHLAAVGAQRSAVLPVITSTQAVAALPALDLWDMWQLQRRDRSTVQIDGRALWFFLAVPRGADPDARHDHARIHLVSDGADGWRDHGPAFPDDFTPGSREWSGSAVLDDDDIGITMHFTAAGRREGGASFEQRLFESRGRLVVEHGAPRIIGWSAPVETVVADGSVYRRAIQTRPVDGWIMGFRDPGWFRDPADGREYLFFTGSAGWVDERFDGLIGVARHDNDGWTLLPPAIDALGLNNELERPHVIARDGRYYLFWSTQASHFIDRAHGGPTGLYAMVADSITGPWHPVNGTTLVAGNPSEEGAQAYCWWVTGDLEVLSFIDLWGVRGRRMDDRLRRTQFGGTIAPRFRLIIDGDQVTIA